MFPVLNDQPSGESCLVAFTRDSRLQAGLAALRRTDNHTNLLYVLRGWLVAAVVIGGTVAFYELRRNTTLGFWWNVPVTLVAILAIGACQHQLAGGGHEGAHHTLFRNRYMNELVSDWLCMFPLFSSTYAYRLYHLAHHQFTNDAERDPDIMLLRETGHLLNTPLPPVRTARLLLTWLLPSSLVRYGLWRARSNALGSRSPYLSAAGPLSLVPATCGMVYAIALYDALLATALLGNRLWLLVIPLAGWAAITAVYCVLPSRAFRPARLRPVVPLRATAIMQTTFVTLVFTALAWTTALTNRPVWLLFFLLLWVLPLLTAFPAVVILRQAVQHANAGRTQLTNTRVFLMNPLLRFALFPFGQDYHLPHHMFASVPHYRLRRLHDLLMTYSEYRAQAVVTSGYALPERRPARRPTLLEVLGPAFTPRRPAKFEYDHTVLDDDVVEEREKISTIQ